MAAGEGTGWEGSAGSPGAAGLRGFMAQVAGTASGVDWAGTFGWILVPGIGVGAFSPGPDLALDTPRGALVAVYDWSFLAVLMLACAIPHRAVTPQHAP